MNPMSIRASRQAATPLNAPDELTRFFVAGIDMKRLLHGRLLAEILLRKTVVKRLELLDLFLHYNPRFVDLGGEANESSLLLNMRELDWLHLQVGNINLP